VARVAAFQRFAAGQDGFGHEFEMLARGVQSQFARGGEDRVAMDDDDAFAFGAGEFLEAFAEFDFFAGKQVGVEAAEFAERGGFTKDERAGDPAEGAADGVPRGGDGVAGGIPGFEADGAAAGEASAGGNLRRDVVEERGAGVGVGIDEEEPIAGGGLGAAIAGAADLVDGLKDDAGSGGAGDFRGAVGGIVVADDEFRLPSPPGKGAHGGADVAKGFAQELFFVERRNYDGDEHTNTLSVQRPMSQGGNSKRPSSKFQRSSKVQGPKVRAAGCLAFGISPGLGGWDLELRRFRPPVQGRRKNAE
jgi:hypothetical protein